MILSDKDYDFIYSKSPRTCVDIVIRSDKGVLMIQRVSSPYNKKFSLPGGRVKFRESINKAISRIAKKEIGVDVKVEKLLGWMEFLKETQNKSKRHSVSLVFLCSTSQPPKNESFFSKNDKSLHPVHAKFLIENKLIKKL